MTAHVRSRKKSAIPDDEELSPEEIASLKRAQKDVKAGRVTRFRFGKVKRLRSEREVVKAMVKAIDGAKSEVIIVCGEVR